MVPDPTLKTGGVLRWLKKWAFTIGATVALIVGTTVFFSRQDGDFDTRLNDFALGLLIFVVLALLYGIIAIHNVPYEIAKKRGHPHQDAIHAAGWVSLFTLHALWPILWIWAMVYRPEHERGFEVRNGERKAVVQADELEKLVRRIEILEARQRLDERRSRTTRADEQPRVAKTRGTFAKEIG